MNIIGLKREWQRVRRRLDEVIGWPNGVQNDCYRCKNQEAEKVDWSKMFDVFKRKMDQDSSKFNFFFFMLVSGTSIGMGYTFWHIWLRKN